FLRELVLIRATAGQSLRGLDLASRDDARRWFEASTTVVDSLRTVEQRQAEGIHSRSESLSAAEQQRAYVIAGGSEEHTSELQSPLHDALPICSCANWCSSAPPRGSRCAASTWPAATTPGAGSRPPPPSSTPCVRSSSARPRASTAAASRSAPPNSSART